MRNGIAQETLAFKTKELEHTNELATSQEKVAEAESAIQRLEGLHKEAVDEREILGKTEAAENVRLQSKLDAVNKELDAQIRQRARAESELDRSSHLVDTSEARCRDLEQKIEMIANELAREKSERAADAQTHEMHILALQSESRRKYEELDLRRRASWSRYKASRLWRIKSLIARNVDSRKKRKCAARRKIGLTPCRKARSASYTGKGCSAGARGRQRWPSSSREEGGIGKARCSRCTKNDVRRKGAKFGKRAEAADSQAKQSAMLVSQSEMTLRNAILSFQAKAMSKIRGVEASFGGSYETSLRGGGDESSFDDMSSGDDFNARAVFDRILRALRTFDGIRTRVHEFLGRNERAWMKKLERVNGFADKLASRLASVESKSNKWAAQARQIIHANRDKESMLSMAIRQHQGDMLKELRTDRTAFEEQRRAAAERESGLCKKMPIL